MNDKIIIRGAKEHNLKNVNLELPKNKLIVFTGLSGSGKSSLAFDTIYAEGQRRYVESLSSYARQFLGLMSKPDVDSIEGLSPAISIDQKSTSHNPRSTVGTITEIYDYLRLLFARIGHPHCPNCGLEITKQSYQQIVDATINIVNKLSSGYGKKPIRLMVLSPIVRDRKGEFKELFQNLKRKGFRQIRIDGRFYNLDDDIILIKTNKHNLELIIDRLSIDSNYRKEINTNGLRRRIQESIQQSLAISEGLVIISEVKDSSFNFPDSPKKYSDILFSERFACSKCNLNIPEIEPRLFSFNSPHGACLLCTGIGHLMKVNPDLVFNKNLSISEGGILPFARTILSDTWMGRLILAVAKYLGIKEDEPLKNTTIENINKLLYGTKEDIYEVKGENRHGKNVTIHEIYKGIIPELETRYSQTDSIYVRAEISKYLKLEVCPQCNGKRLKKEALSVTINSQSIVAITNLSIKYAINWIRNINSDMSDREKSIANLIIKEISNRLEFLNSVGLDYLTLDRSASSLSGGEAQRIRLASQIGSGLSGVLYVLDEPSIGLHPKDNNRLINTLKNLRDLGNTLIVVEHDYDIMKNSDLIIDFGPKAGEHGGKIIASGTFEQICSNSVSLTGKYLSGVKKIKFENIKVENIIKDENILNIEGCSENNLKNINVRIPLQKLVCVTGVSGSGKSTLVVNTIYQILSHYFNPYHKDYIGKYDKINGLDKLKRVVLIDQSPIGRTPRSNPATYTGAFTYIRYLFSQTIEAKMRGFQLGRFSFNIKGGRCEVCCGEGQIKIEMQFLPDVYITCDVCHGTRFNQDTLDIKFKNKSIADILQMTVEQALIFFEYIPGLANKLNTLQDVGLSYIKLGQPAPQLSGGEAQRVKLASELAKKNTKNTIFILDEPTTGLHFADLEKLLHVLRELVKLGNTVLIIEHNLDVIKNSDWIIDLGPEGGESGGYIVGEGTPEKLIGNKKSYTGQYLHQILKSNS